MKRITKKRLADQIAAIESTKEVPLPDDIAKHLLDIQSMLHELDTVSSEKDKFKAATDLMLAVGILNPKDAKRALESAKDYR